MSPRDESRDRSEAREQERHNRQRRLIDHAPDAIIIHDANGRILDVNEAACRSLGYARDALMALRRDEIESEFSTAALEEALLNHQGEMPLRLIGRHLRQNGSSFPVELSVGTLRRHGRKAVFISVCRDISDRLAQQRAMERAMEDLSKANARAETAMAAKNRFMATASHRLRVPLHTILGLSELVAGAGPARPASQEKIVEYLGDIRQAGRELVGVIDELAGMATRESPIAADQRSYRAIIEMSPDSIFLCQGGVISFVNQAGIRLLGGYDASQIEGRALADFVHPDYRVLCEDNFVACIGERTATPMKFLHPSGRVLDVVVSLAAAPDGPGNVLVIVRNISDFMRANRDLAAQAKRLNSILDTAVDAVVVSDEDGRIETFNRAAETMFGLAADEAVGKAFLSLLDEDGTEPHPGLKSIFEQENPNGGGSALAVIARRRDGSLFPAELSLSVCNLDDRRLFTAMIRDITERRNFERNLAFSATHDALTGLPNRILMQERLQEAMGRAAASGGWVAVWFINLDGFKMVNDVLGHAAGDQLVIEAGRRMLATVRPEDIVARFGGDEFAIIVSGRDDEIEVSREAERFLGVLARPFQLHGREVALTANIGIALYPEHSRESNELVVHASAAMLAAKAGGRNLFRFFNPSMHQQTAERLTLETELRRGITRGELMLHYQPQIEAASGTIVGVEALVRWNHPDAGMIPPGRFIPIAEQTGLIVPLGEWVLRQACLDLKRLAEMGLADISMGVNISPRQFNDADMLALIESVIGETGIDPARLDVEITESTLMSDPENVVTHLERMKALGIRLSIDDFGTGYSSLNYLKRFPVDTLKIDRSFVTDIGANPKDEAIAVTIITLAHAMGMTVLAEGVENARQSEILVRLGCDIIQGYHYGMPMAFNALTGRLKAEAIAAS